MVSENGSSYVAKTQNTGVDPQTDVAGAGTNWAVQALAGAASASGATGATGATGPQGSIGPAGPQGIQGIAGATGPTGIQGPPGINGASGSSGATGPAGPTGATGVTGMTWQQTFVQNGTYHAHDAVAYQGSSYIALHDNSGATAPASDTTNWQLLAQAGAIGTTGPAGATGSTGATGATGATGTNSITSFSGDGTIITNSGSVGAVTASVAPHTGAGSIVLAISPTLVSPARGTPTSLVATNITGVPNASAKCGSDAVTGNFHHAYWSSRLWRICTGTCTVTVPVPVAGYEFCVMNDDNISTSITLLALGGGGPLRKYIENGIRNSTGTGTLSSSAAIGNKVCIVGRDATHYMTVSFTGTWTAN